MFKKAIGALGAVGAAVGLTAEGSDQALELGVALPDVSAVAHDGKAVNLSEAGKEGYVLVYFYPKADTPGCTKQACSLRDSFVRLTEKNVTVFGVSTDSMEVQRAFAEKYKLPFSLLADEKKEVVKAFGVGTIPAVGLAKRQAFLFKDGVLVWRDLSASTEQQAADVLAFLKV